MVVFPHLGRLVKRCPLRGVLEEPHRLDNVLLVKRESVVDLKVIHKQSQADAQ